MKIPCVVCRKEVYRSYYCADELTFCSTECKQKNEIKSIPLNLPCCICNGEIIISEGFTVSKKKN